MSKMQPREKAESMQLCEHTHPSFSLDSKHLSPIRYDITGVQPDRVQEIIEADWYHLLQEQRFLLSPNYLREDGKPVIAIWGAYLWS